MKLRKGWEITTSHGDTFVVLYDQGTINWAKRHGYSFKRVFVLKQFR